MRNALNEGPMRVPSHVGMFPHPQTERETGVRSESPGRSGPPLVTRLCTIVIRKRYFSCSTSYPSELSSRLECAVRYPGESTKNLCERCYCKDTPKLKAVQRMLGITTGNSPRAGSATPNAWAGTSREFTPSRATFWHPRPREPGKPVST